MRIAALGDRHLDRLSPKYAHAVATWRRALDDAEAQSVGAFVGLGDVCEDQPDGPGLITLSELYSRQKESGLVLEVLGNHEADDALGFLEPWGIHVAWNTFKTVMASGALLLGIPYPRRGHPPFHDLPTTSIRDSMQGAVDRIAETVEGALKTAQYYKVPLIVAAHVTVGGMRMGASNFELHLGDEVVVPPRIFQGCALVLTGHIHRAQEIPDNIVGVGSLFRCDKSEANDEKSYTMVTVDNGAVTWERRVVPQREIVDLKFEWSDILNGAEIPVIPDAEVFVTLTIDEQQIATYDPKIFDQVRASAAYFKLDRITRTAERRRAPDLEHVQTMDEEFVIWAQSLGIDLSGRMDRILPKLQQLPV